RRIDTNATLSLRASQECAVGYVSLKLIGFMSLKAASLLDELLKSEGVMIHEVFRLLSSTLDWQLLAASGWPLFRLLARLEYFAHLEMGSANPLNDQLLSTWAYEIPFLETVEHHLLRGTPVPAAASSLVLSYTDYYSPLARALALLALADVLRAPQRLTPEELGESNRLVRRAVYLLSEHFLSATYPPFVALSARWPIFQLADRLACQA
ncbi:WW domain-containing protein, partial [Durusdinium trenchii]